MQSQPICQFESNLELPSRPTGFPEMAEGWEMETEKFEGTDGIELFGRIFKKRGWEKEQNPKVCVVLHGQGEHSGRYLHLTHYLGNLFSAFYLIDHRGHGNSGGNKGHASYFDIYAKDAFLAIKRFKNFVDAQGNGAEIYLVGHSMGGLITLRTLMNHQDLPIKKAVVSSPMFKLAFQVPKIKEVAGKILSMVLPSLPLPGEPIAQNVSRDPNVVEHYTTDPLNHGFASPGFYFGYLKALKDTYQRPNDIKIPILFQVAMSDRIIDAHSTLEFYNSLKSKDKKIITYENLFHEIYNEPEKEKVFGDLVQWIKN